MKKSLETLPEGYTPRLTVDLKNDKRLAVLVNALAIIIAAVMVVPMVFAVPLSTAFDAEDGIIMLLVRAIVLLFGMIAYIILHEAVHGVAMKICGTKKIKFGFTGLYAFAGSTDYYAKAPYIFIALAPVVLFGAVLLALNLLVPLTWFWVVYLIQIINISGAAGDIYVTVRFFGLPRDILVQDAGVSMVVYSKE